jgi:hypothetical protein
MKTVTIDPGHGGYETGATFGDRYEKNDNLRLGLALRDKLQGLGLRVIMTRNTDAYVSLTDRSRISNNADSDLFISLHRNSSTNPNVYGTANYIQNGSGAITRDYAQSVLSEVVAAGVSRNIGIIYDDFSVLRNTRAPAQLLELGFISNANDNVLFDKNFNAYVDAIARGIMNALGEKYPAASANKVVIRGIQQALNNRYGAGLSADGLYGSNTKRALTKGLQLELNRSYGAKLTADGIFGAKTKAAVPLLKNGSRNDLVYLLQAALFVKGYGTVPDGIFGAITTAAVKKFQRDNYLSADGIAGPDTFAALFGK